MMNRPIVRRTQAERTRETRERILLCAADLFSKHGFNGAVMAEIAAAAGLSLPGLLHHFPNKNILLMAVLAERDKANGQRFQPEQTGKYPPPFSAFLELVEFNQSVPGMVKLFTILVAESLQEDHPAHSFFVGRYSNARIDLVSLIKKAQQDGELRKDLSADDVFSLVFAVMDGLQIQWLLQPQSINMAKTFASFIKLLQP